MHQLTRAGSSTRRSDGRRQRLFVVVWSLSSATHALKYVDDVGRQPTLWILLLASLWAIERPSSVNRLLLLAGVQIIDFVSFAPDWDNDQALMLCFHLALFTHALGSRRALFGRVVPTWQILMVGAYGAAALAKHNESFVDPLQSCANVIAETISFQLLDGPRLGIVPVLVAAGVESAVPLLLLSRRTRSWGARLGITFHLLLSFSPLVLVEDFTFAVVAGFILFLPREDVDSIHRVGVRIRRSSALRRAALNAIPPGARSALLVVVIASLSIVASVRDLPWIVVLLVGPGIIAGMAQSARHPTTPERWPAPNLLRALPSVVVLVTLAASPYLGLRNIGTFTMFSNLRIETGSSNHLFIPDVAVGTGSEGIAIGPGSSSYYQPLVGQPTSLTRFELERLSAQLPDEVAVPLDPEVELRPPMEGWWQTVQNKFRRFRSVSSLDQRVVCEP